MESLTAAYKSHFQLFMQYAIVKVNKLHNRLRSFCLESIDGYMHTISKAQAKHLLLDSRTI